MPWKIIDRLLLPAAFFLIAFVVALTLWQLLIGHRRAEIQGVTSEQARFVKTKMESELQARIVPLERLAGAGPAHSGQSPSDIEFDAKLVMSAYPAYQAVEWVDPSYHVRWVTPSTQNQSELGADLGSNDLELSALRQAAQTGDAVVTHSVALRQGGRGVLVCVPVKSDNQLSGFLVGVFRFNDLIPAILQNVAPGYWVAVYDGNEEIYRPGPALAPRDAEWAQTTEIQFQQLNWRAQVWPKPETRSYTLSLLPRFAFIGGILMAGLMAFTVYLAETARLNAKEVAASNKELKKEITVREQAEQALREAQKMEAVGRLAGGIAHDFNNLLMVIRGHAALSLNRVGSDGSLRRELNEILKVTDRAASLTRRLLAFSRKQVLQLRVLDLNTLVGQVKDLLPPVIGEDIRLVMDLDPELGRVKADYAQMEQVIMNLVFNARDAMPEGGELMIQTANAELDEAFAQRHAGAQPGQHVMLAVHDTGRGMNEDVLSHIFEPFFTTKDRTKGTGLGLATVYGTVRQSGGCITVASRLGEGTTFQIYLPRVEDPVEVTEPKAAEPQPAKGAETILVVEDDDAVRRMTREFLKIHGYTVIEARSAAIAIQIMEAQGDAIDMVLTDVLMPGMKGRELIGRLMTMRPDLKVLYMSAYTEDAAINIGVLNPGTEFIEKPFGPDDLAAKVRDVLTRTPTV
ncbi:MAG TPA: ATP-binding protein [Candidatus Acidoferrales bacterium]|jgi:signal transduction histidine kinase/CheY-like chemotaxis protein|nr:ATP-binding protein [Candidatus Acidoferrales bacterium]